MGRPGARQMTTQTILPTKDGCVGLGPSSAATASTPWLARPIMSSTADCTARKPAGCSADCNAADVARSCSTDSMPGGSGGEGGRAGGCSTGGGTSCWLLSTTRNSSCKSKTANKQQEAAVRVLLGDLA